VSKSRTSFPPRLVLLIAAAPLMNLMLERWGVLRALDPDFRPAVSYLLTVGAVWTGWQLSLRYARSKEKRRSHADS